MLTRTSSGPSGRSIGSTARTRSDANPPSADQLPASSALAPVMETALLVGAAVLCLVVVAIILVLAAR